MSKNWAQKPFHPAKWPFFYGYMILVWGTIGVVMSIPGQTIGVSVFTDSLLQILNISRDQLSLAYMFGTIGSSFLLPWAGRQYDKFGARPVAFFAAIGLGLILIMLSQIDRILFGLMEVQSELIVVVAMFVLFLMLRFFGQGVLTMTSRNMMVQWFDKRRGLAMGVSNVIISLSFSIAPVVLYGLIQSYSWRGAWQVLSVVLLLGFTVLVVMFYRNKPEDSGLLPDGGAQLSVRKRKLLFPIIKEFNLSEVRRNYSFWVYTLMLAMQGLYITAFTFHVISIFDEVELGEQVAITIFQPSAVVAVLVTLVFSTLSDYIELKYLYLAKGLAACIGIVGVILLGSWEVAYWLIVVGNGAMGGLFAVLSSVTWPRYFGRLHLGAISGQSIMVVVFASALGPILFSQSLTLFGSYAAGGWVCFAVYLLLTIGCFWTDNPQKGLRGR